MSNVNKKQLPAFLVLTIISLVAALVLAVTNEVTKGPIAEHAARARREAFNTVLQAADYQEIEVPAGHESVSALYKAVDENGAELGYTVVASASGYAGPVAVTLGVGSDGMVTGAVIGDTSFAETAGFGMRWKEETDRWEQFRQIDTANGGAIEAITGATVTSNAVLNATNAAINCVNEARGVAARDVVEKGTPAAPVVEQVALEGGIHEGSAKGFASDVRVQLTMDDAGVVTGLNIDAMGETMGFGTRASTEPEFAQQFVGKAAPFAAGENIDTLTGATVTSKAVIEAVNAACAAPVNPDAVPFDLGGDAGAEEPAVETVAQPLPADALVGTARGFASDVKAVVTLDENGAIATLTIDSMGETPSIGTRCTEDEAFAAQFIGKTIPVEGIDVLSGATVTSNAVIAAVNAAEVPAPAEILTAKGSGYGSGVVVNVTLNEDGTIATLDIDVSGEVPPICNNILVDAFVNQFIGRKGPFVAGEGVDIVSGATYSSNGVIEALNSLFPAEEVAEVPAVDVTTEATSGATAVAEPAVEAAAEVLTAKGSGYGSGVVVNVTLNEDGTIATLDIDVSGEVPPICNNILVDTFVNQFIGRKGPFVAGEGVDIVSGATYSSNGVIEALNSLFPAEEVVAEPAGEELTGKAEGFQSDVVVTLTVADGVITAIKVDSSNETPGFGTRCGEDAAYLAQFVGKKATPDLGEGIDALSGATVTSNAVIEAANAAIGVAVAVVDVTTEATTGATAVAEPAVEAAAEVLTAKGSGYGSGVVVNVTLNEDGTIATLDIDVSGEVPPICNNILVDAFVNQFIGRKGPFVAGEGVDIVSGATYSSNGVIEALNSLFPAEEVAEVPAVDVTTEATTGATAVAEPAVEAAAEVLTAKGSGYGSGVVVNVTLNEDGTIATLDIDVSGEVPPICNNILVDTFVNQFIGRKGPFVAGEGVDIVSGATYSSNGVIEALNSLFPAEEVAEVPAVDVTTEATSGATAVAEPETETAADEPTQDMSVTGEEGPVAPAAATVTVPAYGGQDVTVTVTFNEDGTIAALVVDASTQSPGLGRKCGEERFTSQFIGLTAPLTIDDIDAVSYATITCQAVVDAVNAAADQQ